MIGTKINQHAILYTVIFSILALMLDYLTGPYIQLPILFVIPVFIVAWHRHWYLGLGIAVILSSLSFSLTLYWHSLLPQSVVESAINTFIRIVGLGILAYFTSYHRTLQQQVRVLQGILPICSFCKRIRDNQGHWQNLESYIHGHSEAEFSHGICPLCAQQHYGVSLSSQGAKQTR